MPRLVAAGHNVVCLARDPAALTGRGWERVDVRKGDALDVSSLRRAMKGVDVAYYLIHSMAAADAASAGRDRATATRFGLAARATGVGRIIYLSALDPADGRLTPRLASRREVGDLLRSSGVPVTELRVAVIVGSGSVSFELIRRLADTLPVLLAPRWTATCCQPIAITNVLDYLVRALDEPRTVGRTFEIGGPEPLTFADLIRGYADECGLRRLVLAVPLEMPRMSAVFLHFLSPVPAALLSPLIEELHSDRRVRDGAAEPLFGVTLVSYREAVRRALARIESGAVESFWADAQWGISPGVVMTNVDGMIVEERRVETQAPPESVFATVCGVGGDGGWFYANWAWRLRGVLDRVLGGVGMHRGRRVGNQLRLGDALDFWRVEALEPGRLLRLRAEMKLPGRAWLQFKVAPSPGGGTLLNQTAFYDPHGIPGLAYWYLLYPIHKLIFSGMVRAIARSAETTGSHGAPPCRPTSSPRRGPTSNAAAPCVREGVPHG